MKRFLTIILLFVAFFVTMVVIIPSGSHYCNLDKCGMYFWGAHEHDAIWHLALANNSFKVWPFTFPTFAGETLSGYNAMYDIVLSTIARLTKIDAVFLYFKILPLLWFGTMIYTWSKFGNLYSKNKWYTCSLLFFVFFGNSFSYLLRLGHEGIIWGASGLLAMQSPQVLTNMQFAWSLPILAIILIHFFERKSGIKNALILGLLVFLTMGLKFYGGVIILGMATIYSISFLLEKNNRSFFENILTTTIGFVLATILFYDPFKVSSDPVMSIKLLATVHPIIEDAGLIFLPQIANLRNILIAQGPSIRLVLIELATFVLFIIFNFGTRIIGIWSVNFNWKLQKDKYFHITILLGIAAGIILNITLVQRGEWWNTVQFLYYSLILSAIYAAGTLAKLIDNKSLANMLLAIVVVILTMPNAVDTTRVFFSFPPNSYVSDTELQALKFLSNLPTGTTLALPTGTINQYSLTRPNPLYTTFDTAYVAAFSHKPTYLNDMVQMRLTDIKYQERYINVSTNNCLVLNEIKYIYVSGGDYQMNKWLKCPNEIVPIFTNSEVVIYNVKTKNF